MNYISFTFLFLVFNFFIQSDSVKNNNGRRTWSDLSTDEINGYVYQAITGISKYSDNDSFLKSFRKYDNSYFYGAGRNPDGVPPWITNAQMYSTCIRSADACYRKIPKKVFEVIIKPCRRNKSTLECNGYETNKTYYLSIEEFKILSQNNNYVDDHEEWSYVSYYNNGTQKCNNFNHDKILGINYSKSKLRIENYIYIQWRMFGRGHIDFDPEREILWDRKWRGKSLDDSSHLFYSYALSPVEGLQFLFFHEYAHTCGLREQAAEVYAKKSILELRKAKLGLSYSLDFFPEDFEEGIKSYKKEETVSFIHLGTPPPQNDLPPGTYI